MNNSNSRACKLSYRPEKVDAHAHDRRIVPHTASCKKLAIEAKDNTKFLATLERHFKTLSGGSFAAILDTLPTMLNAVRMVGSFRAIIIPMRGWCLVGAHRA